jgi:hypothetical protein
VGQRQVTAVAKHRQKRCMQPHSTRLSRALTPMTLLVLQVELVDTVRTEWNTAFLGEKMLHVDTFATHQWPCLPGLYRLKP